MDFLCYINLFVLCKSAKWCLYDGIICCKWCKKILGSRRKVSSHECNLVKQVQSPTTLQKYLIFVVWLSIWTAAVQFITLVFEVILAQSRWEVVLNHHSLFIADFFCFFTLHLFYYQFLFKKKIICSYSKFRIFDFISGKREERKKIVRLPKKIRYLAHI